MDDSSDTIAAIATAPGEAGISVVRISGPNSLTIADKVFRGHRKPSSLAGNSFAYGFVQSSSSSSAGNSGVDEVILLVYRAPHSYTREDVVEIQGHGGRVSAKQILRTVLDAGARLAEPGEFTKRAFLNGRIDLLQAEAVADLIMAQSDRAAAAAIEQLDGRLSTDITSIYDVIMDVASDLEATLDFSEEELPATAMLEITDRLEKAVKALQTILDTWEEGHLLREGALVVIAGKPNTGKSTLLNTLLGKDRAIVTNIPGTTRDTIEEMFIVDGIPVRLVDTAGLRDSECLIERDGIQRTQNLIENADMVLYMIDGSQDVDNKDITTVKKCSAKSIIVLNKIDLGLVANASAFSCFPVVMCSLVNGKGIAELRGVIAARLGQMTQGHPHAAISERHRISIQGAVRRAEDTILLLKSGRDDMVAVAASEIRCALDELGAITGRIYSNELLDNIFHRFCLGK